MLAGCSHPARYSLNRTLNASARDRRKAGSQPELLQNELSQVFHRRSKANTSAHCTLASVLTLHDEPAQPKSRTPVYVRLGSQPADKPRLGKSGKPAGEILQGIDTYG